MKTDQPDIRNIIIIGSGPAGYTAALYTARGSLAPLVLAGPQPGGQLTTTTDIENFPGFPEGIAGPQLMENMRKQAERFGAEVKFESVTRVDFSGEIKKVYVNDTEYQARAVIITTGARSRTLELPREQELWAKGIHTCATCDGFFYKGKTVAIVGGGDSAMEEANFLTHFAEKVYVIHRKDAFNASKIMQERTLSNPKIEVVWNTAITGYRGEGKLNGLAVKEVTTGAERTLEVAALFFAIGHIPNTEFLRGIIDLDEKTGYINTRKDVYTDVEGVFAAGDCVDHVYRQAITAAGQGCQAAIAAERWLAGGKSVGASYAKIGTNNEHA